MKKSSTLDWKLITDSCSIPFQAFWESERVAEEKARVKREERVIKQWTRLIQGLRIRQRLQEQYGTKSDRVSEKAVHKARDMGSNNKNEGEGPDEEDLQAEAAQAQLPDEKVRTIVIGEPHSNLKCATLADIYYHLLSSITQETSGHGGGGFLIGADDVVQAFQLPKFQYVPDEPVMSFQDERRSRVAGADSNKTPASAETELEESTSNAPDFITYDLDEDDEMAVATAANIETNMDGASSNPNLIIPKTMAQLAEDAAARQREQHGGSSNTPSRPSSALQSPQRLQPKQTGDDPPSDSDGGDGDKHINADDAQPKRDGDASIDESFLEGSSKAAQLGPTPNVAARSTERKLRSSAKLKAPSPPRSSTKETTRVTTARTRRPRKTRATSGKRARKDVSDDEGSDAGDESNDDDEYDGTGSWEESMPPRKKPRTTKTSIAAAADNSSTSTFNVTAAANDTSTRDVPATTRTLRPRRSKSTA